MHSTLQDSPLIRSLRHRPARVLLIGLAFLLWPSWLDARHAHAQLHTPSAQSRSIVLRRPALHWVRADDALGCVDPRTLAEHVEALVGPVLVRPSEAEHSIEGRVELKQPGRVHVHVRVLDAFGNKVGEREIEEDAEHCDKLTPAIVFIVGMAIDPEVAAHGLPPSLVALLGGTDHPAEQTLLAEIDELPSGKPEEPREPTPVPAPTTPPPPPPAYQTGLLVRGAFNEAPRALVSLEARALWTVRAPFALGGYVRAGGQLGAHKLTAAQSLRVSATDVAALACAQEPASRALRVQLCLGPELSLGIGRGEDFSGEDHASTRPGLGLVAQLTTRVRLWQGWGLALSLSGRVGLVRRSFSYEASEVRHSAYRYPRTSGGIALGPTYEF